MKFSKKSRYGLTALIDLSVHSKEGCVALSSISERNHLSVQYLEQIFAALRRGGIVKSIKGPQGGYLLNHDAKNITVADVLQALDGNYHLESENADADDVCSGIAAAIQERVIDEVNRRLDEVLKNVTLADMESDYMDRRRYDQGMYYI